MSLTTSKQKLDTETYQEREVRQHIIAQAIGHAAYRATCKGEYNTPDCSPISNDEMSHAAILITIGYWESRFAKHIHEDKCQSGWTKGTNKFKPGECDEKAIVDKQGNILNSIFLARTMWQLHKDKNIAEEWDKMSGTSIEATKNAAWAASKKWAACPTASVKTTVMCYAGTLNPKWKGLMPRVNFYNWNLALIRKLQDKEVMEQYALKHRKAKEYID